MAVNLRDFRSENGNVLINDFQYVSNNLKDLYDSYKVWSKKYAGLIDKYETYFTVRKYYANLISLLNDGKSKISNVYSKADSAEKTLLGKINFSQNRIDIQNLKLKAYRNAISKNKGLSGLGNISSIVDKEMSEVSSAIITKLVETYSQDGRWEELVQSDHLNDEEYMALAIIYFTLDDSDKEKFINCCFGKTGDFKANFGTNLADAFTGGQWRDSCTYWEADSEKVKRLSESMAWLVSLNYEYVSYLASNIDNEEVIDTLIDNRNNLLQEAALFQSIQQIGRITAGYDDEDPGIDLDRGSNGDIIISYTAYGNVGAPTVPTFVNFCDRTVTITRPHCGIANDYKMTEDTRKEFAVKYGISCDFETVADPITDYVTGEIKDYAIERGTKFLAEKAASKGLKKAIGFIPIAGDLIEVGWDIYDGYSELTEERGYAEYLINKIEASNYASALQLSCVYVDWSDPDIKPSVYIEPGVDTQRVIDNYNKKTGDQYGTITMEDVLYKSDEVSEKFRKICSENVDLFNDITRMR